MAEQMMEQGPVILGGSKAGSEVPPKEPASPHEDGEADMSEEEFKAAMDVKAAMSSGDDEDFAVALKNFIEICKGY